MSILSHPTTINKGYLLGWDMWRCRIGEERNKYRRNLKEGI